MTDSRDPVAPEGVFDGISFRSVGLGVLVDHLASLMFGTALLLVLASDEINSEDDAVAEAALDAAVASPEFTVSVLIGGTICTVLAAFVGSRHAGGRYLRHGAWIAAGSTALALLFYPAEYSMTWVDWVGWILILPAGLVGGGLAQWSEGLELERPDDSP